MKQQKEQQQHNICLLLEYDGSRYAGYQQQAAQPTIEGHLHTALQQILPHHKAPTKLFCAGRTDKGVHALGQVVNFYTSHPKEAKRYAPALNHYLPDDIRVHRSVAAASHFDARHCASSKYYRYLYYSGPHTPALDHRRAWHIRRDLDVAAMQKAASYLVGEMDFSSFRSVHCDAPHAIRHMHGIDIRQRKCLPWGQQTSLTMHANAFCRHMCRILAGSLLQVGIGLWPAEKMLAVLKAKDRTEAGQTAPPWGLTLRRVVYQQPQLWFAEDCDTAQWDNDPFAW